MGLRHKDPVKKAGKNLVNVVMLFFLTAFLLLALKNNDVPASSWPSPSR